MVEFVHGPTSEEAKDNKKGNQSFPDLKKQQNNPCDPITFADSEDSVAFVDSLLNFDCIGDWFEDVPPESFFTMATDENPSEVSLGNAEHAVFEKRIEVGCDGFSDRSRLEEGFVEEVEKMRTIVVKTEEKEVEDCDHFSCEKDFDQEGIVGDEVGSLDDLGYLIEEEMGKVALDGVSSCLVPHSGDADKGEGSGGGGVGVNGNGMKLGGSVVGNTVGSNDHPASESEENSSSSETSNSSDVEVEMEEGEIMASEVEEMVAWSGDEDDEVGGNVSGGPLRSKNELTVLPPVPPVKVTLQPHHQTLPVGVVLSIVGAQVIVEGVEKHNPLNEGSILWITQSRCPLGIVDEIFGPVKNAYYIIRYNSESEVPSGLQPGDSVSFVQEFANHILHDKSLYEKAYDASGANDEELVEEEEFSDDEKEAEFRKLLKMKKRGSNHENAENKNMERRELKNRSGNWKRDHAPSQRTGQGNQLREDRQHPVAPKLDLGNEQCSSSLGHDSSVRPEFVVPSAQLRQNPGFTVPSARADGIPFQPPQNMGVAGFPTNSMPWLGQVNPQMLYQMNMQNGLQLQQQFGMTANFPPNPVFPTVQPGFGAAPAFTPWPSALGQNMLNTSVFPMVAAGQQLPFPFNAGQQAFPFSMQQNGHNSYIKTDVATSGKPETFGSSSQGLGQNLSNPSQFGIPMSVGEQAFHSNVQQMAHNSSVQPDLAAAGSSRSLNQGYGQNLFNPSQFGMAASGQQQSPLLMNIEKHQAFPSSSQQMGFGMAASGQNQSFPSSTQQMVFGMTASGQQNQSFSSGTPQMGFGMAASGQQQNQAFPSGTQQMGFGMAASGQQQNQAFPNGTQQMGFGMAASGQQQNQAFPSGTHQMGFGMAASGQQQNQAFPSGAQQMGFGVAASGQQQNQAFPSSNQQMEFGMAASGQPQNQAIPSSNQQMGFGMAASGQQQNSHLMNIEKQALPSSTQQMGFSSTVKPNLSPSGRPDTSPGPNQGRGGGRKQHRRGRGGGRFGGGRGGQQSY